MSLPLYKKIGGAVRGVLIPSCEWYPYNSKFVFNCLSPSSFKVMNDVKRVKPDQRLGLPNPPFFSSVYSKVLGLGKTKMEARKLSAK